jgi:nitrate/nitrite transporter NarK
VEFVAQAFQAQAPASLAARFGVAEAYYDKMLGGHGSDRVNERSATFVTGLLMPVNLLLVGAFKSSHQLSVPLLGIEREYRGTKNVGSGINVLARFGLINIGHEGHN